MIWAFLTTRGFLGLAKGIWVAIAAGLIVAAVLWLTAAEKADDRANQEIGATVQREGDLRETIERTETANEAREESRTRTDDQRNADCLRRSRTPENC
jgi:hypothetical protein